MFFENLLNFEDHKTERTISLISGLFCFSIFSFSMLLYINLNIDSIIAKTLKIVFYLSLLFTIVNTAYLAKKQNRSSLFWGLITLIIPLSAVLLSFLETKYNMSETNSDFSTSYKNYDANLFNSESLTLDYKSINFQIEVTKVAQHTNRQIIIHGLLKNGEFPETGCKFKIDNSGETALIDNVVNLNKILAKQAMMGGIGNATINTTHLALTTSNLNLNQVKIGDYISSI